MIIVIDNYDSFTYNLVQYLGELAQELPVASDIRVYRNDAIDIETIKQLKPDGILISPGPGRPEDAGISLQLIAQLGSKIPILGVCLGHQSIGQVFGGKIVSAPVLMHGKTSPIYHQNLGVFAGIDSPFTATRYHSLVIEPETIPDTLEITAWVEVQFHPESILTDHGKSLLRNFLQSLGQVKI